MQHEITTKTCKDDLSKTSLQLAFMRRDNKSRLCNTIAAKEIIINNEV